jgi:hypothetical protein
MRFLKMSSSMVIYITYFYFFLVSSNVDTGYVDALSRPCETIESFMRFFYCSSKKSSSISFIS